MILALLLISAPLGLDQYRAQLIEIDARLARGDRKGAASLAQSLRGAIVRAGEEELSPDEWVLAPIARGEPRRARLHSLVEALASAEAPGPAADRALLSALRADLEAGRPKAGGEIAPLDAPGATLREQTLAWVAAAARFVVRQIVRFVRWLWSLFPEEGPSSAEPGRILPAVLVGVAIIVLGMVLLALLSFRRGAPRAAAPAGPQRPGPDEDPASRTAAGWEQRARELAAAGRAREAIRAWYHALLMRCAAEGLLHYRRGRTNWEYAHALPPSLPWRGRFADLTSRFEVEWYGRSASTPEALAAFADGSGEILRALGRQT